MMGLARRLHAALLGKEEPQQAGQPVDGILLDDHGESITLDGHVMHVDANGCLIMGEVDHLFGASEEAVAALPTQTLESTSALGEQTLCTICQSDFRAGETVMTLPCGHHYHGDCLKPWLGVSKNCPLCEAPID
uniref:RING-type domain-containing protein n=1 Tax=Alexandrium monilatum TaxID=311494 RepID=A0A7S4RYN1_9DINO|mmetsp:Transcript_31651/g.94268  ORF Transcript_31651/g.94268 Transcript_31651/m.94268 type:complete len:134 (-) Transcript_31651:253-654(-)